MASTSSSNGGKNGAFQFLAGNTSAGIGRVKRPKQPKTKVTSPTPRGYTHYKPSHADREQVKKLVLLGANHEKIAGCLGISEPILMKHYQDTLSFYQARMLGNVAGKAYGMALKGNPFMVQFVLKTRAGWKENLLSENDTTIIKRVLGVPDEDV